MTDLAVTDTHAIVWVAKGEWRRLGKAARRAFERADSGQGVIHVPALALVEVGEGLRSGRIQSGRSLASWTEALFSSPSYRVVALTAEIVLRAETLYAIPERGDRLIAATAAELDLPLITRDSEIARVAGVQAIW